MDRRITGAVEAAGWALGALASAALCLATWRAGNVPEPGPPPTPLPRPVTADEADEARRLEAELAVQLERWRATNGRWPTPDELPGALQDGLLPDNPAHPDVSGLTVGCAPTAQETTDWRYCPQTGAIRAAGATEGA